MTDVSVQGQLVLADRVVPGRIDVEGDRISAVVTGAGSESREDGPYLCPGFVDIHVHGWGGHDAAGGLNALDGMARALIAHGVTSFLPTAETAPLDALVAFAGHARAFVEQHQPDRAEALGFNLEGPFISPRSAGAQNPAYIRRPADVDRQVLEQLVPGCRVWTVAPEVDGALSLIRWLSDSGSAVSLGHSDATAGEASAGFDAGARSTTHLFNAMTGFDHHAPGLAAAALARDDAFVELIVDGLHVDRWLWPTVLRAKPGRVVLVSDAIAPAGMGDGDWVVGGLAVTVRAGECRLASNGRLAGSVIALDEGVRNLVRSGVALPDAVAAASRVPLECIGVTDRGRLEAGAVADLVELDAGLRVGRVMKSGRWLSSSGGA
jgi:N-acetylglucosamine-6-phosphate deacetylase